MTNCNSTEFEDNPEHAAVVFMPEISKTHLGGTITVGKQTNALAVTVQRFGHYTAKVTPWTSDTAIAMVNPDLIESIEAAGLVFVGKDESGQRCGVLKAIHISLACSSTHEFVAPGRPSRHSSDCSRLHRANFETRLMLETQCLS